MASELEYLQAVGADRNPIQEERFKELTTAGASGHPGAVPSPTGSYLTPGGAPGAAPGGSPMMQDFTGMVSQAQQMYQQAAQPQIQALEAQRPDIETRYKDLIADITKTGRAAKTAEYGRRGLPVSSGMMEHQLGQQLAGPIAQAGQARGGEMQNLAMTIANLQAGGQTGAIQTALSMLGMQTQAKQSSAELAMRKWAEEEATRRAGMVTPGQQFQQQQWRAEQPWIEEQRGMERQQFPMTLDLLRAQIARQYQLASGATGESEWE